jgi:hypothetical protein
VAGDPRKLVRATKSRGMPHAGPLACGSTRVSTRLSAAGICQVSAADGISALTSNFARFTPSFTPPIVVAIDNRSHPGIP